MARRVLNALVMSEGLNMVTLLGNLGADPELTQTSGGAVLKMRLATTEVYFDKENKKQEKTEWHSVTTFGRRAEGLSKFLRKGARVFVKGRLETSSYEKNGEKRYTTGIIATNILLGGQPNGMMNRPPAPAASLAPADLPF